MMPCIDPRDERRKKRGRAAGLISFITIITSSLFHPGWWVLGTNPRNWVLLAAGTVISVAVAVSADLPGARVRVGHGRGNGFTGHGRDADDGPIGAGASYPRRVLVTASRLMPRSAGRRWLAEAESLLAEIKPGQRGAAIRSYLLSAPGLIVTMWARAAQRRAWFGPRRPG